MTTFNPGDRVDVAVLETCDRPGRPPLFVWNSPRGEEPVSPFTYVRESGCNGCYVIEDAVGSRYFIAREHVRPESQAAPSGVLDPVAQRMVKIYRDIVGQVIARGFDAQWNAIACPLGLPAATDTSATTSHSLASAMGVRGATSERAAQVYRDFTRTVRDAGYGTQWHGMVVSLGLPGSYITLAFDDRNLASALGLDQGPRPATTEPEPEPEPVHMNDVAFKFTWLYYYITKEVVRRGYATQWDDLFTPFGYPPAAEIGNWTVREISDALGVTSASREQAGRLFRDIVSEVYDAGYAYQWLLVTQQLDLPDGGTTLRMTGADLADALNLPADDRADAFDCGVTVITTEPEELGTIVARVWDDGSGGVILKRPEGWIDAEGGRAVPWDEATRHCLSGEPAKLVLLSDGRAASTDGLSGLLALAEGR